MFDTRPRIMSTLELPYPADVTYVDKSALRPLDFLRRVVAEATDYDAVILNGAVGIDALRIPASWKAGHMTVGNPGLHPHPRRGAGRPAPTAARYVTACADATQKHPHYTIPSHGGCSVWAYASMVGVSV